MLFQGEVQELSLSNAGLFLSVIPLPCNNKTMSKVLQKCKVLRWNFSSMHLLCSWLTSICFQMGVKLSLRQTRARIQNQKGDCLNLSLFPLNFSFLMHSGILKPGPPLYPNSLQYCVANVPSLLYFVNLRIKISLSTYLEFIM